MAFLGMITFALLILQLTNNVKGKGVKWVDRLSKHHKLMGIATGVTAILHASIAVTAGEYRYTGVVTMIALLITGYLGSQQDKGKNVLKWHKIFASATLLLAIQHMILNANI